MKRLYDGREFVSLVAVHLALYPSPRHRRCSIEELHYIAAADAADLGPQLQTGSNISSDIAAADAADLGPQLQTGSNISSGEVSGINDSDVPRDAVTGG
eukprot:m51a1_g9797 hypothetical protein (99) ;mRNA; r:1773067-1775997